MAINVYAGFSELQGRSVNRWLPIGISQRPDELSLFHNNGARKNDLPAVIEDDHVFINYNNYQPFSVSVDRWFQAIVGRKFVKEVDLHCLFAREDLEIL